MPLRSRWIHTVACSRRRRPRLAPVWSWPIPLEARTQRRLLPNKVIPQRQTWCPGRGGCSWYDCTQIAAKQGLFQKLTLGENTGLLGCDLARIRPKSWKEEEDQR